MTALDIGAVINAGDAKSQGVEMGLSGKLTDHLSASVAYTYTDASLATVSPPDGVPASSYSVGAKLPGVPDQAASVSLQYAQASGSHDADLRGRRVLSRASLIGVAHFPRYAGRRFRDIRRVGRSRP